MALIFVTLVTSNHVVGTQSFASVLSGNIDLVKKLYDFKLNGISYYEFEKEQNKPQKSMSMGFFSTYKSPKEECYYFT